MKLLLSKFTCIIFLLFGSCSENIDQTEKDGTNSSGDTDPRKSLVETLTKNSSSEKNVDFENLLNSGKNLPTMDVNTDNEDITIIGVTKSSPNTSEKLDGNDLAAEKAFKNLEVNSLEHQKSIDDLRLINRKKDQTISTLTKLNDELVKEIKKLKDQSYSNFAIESSIPNKPETDLGVLRSEIKKLKNNLALKSEELKSLRFRNDSLEGRIIELEKSPSITTADLLPRFNEQNSLSNSTSSYYGGESASGECTLQFEAVVTALNGKSKEAFFTEFFVLPSHLEEILRKGGIQLSDYSGVDTYAELWARSRKNSFLFPGVHKDIRSLLLDFIQNGNGQRIRTDVNGEGVVSGLSSGKYFVIGTASLGKVGVTWNVPVVLNNGNNKISLTLANCDWSL